ncbi:MAG TPA: hypothetical protein VFI53_09755, partial [Myxococcaceae bacterium]|nr:hypothetical protein [Myxococcaceae bacterium]
PLVPRAKNLRVLRRDRRIWNLDPELFTVNRGAPLESATDRHPLEAVEKISAGPEERPLALHLEEKTRNRRRRASV